MSQNEIEKKSLKVEIMEKMVQLATSGFGLVAALAWNDFIRALFTKLFPKPENSIFAMFFYAVIITVLIVVVTLQIGRVLELARRQLNTVREEDTKEKKNVEPHSL